MTDKNRSVALVTGASSGIGLATAESLVKAGYRVFGTSRKPAADRPGITMLICDVAEEASVQAAVAEVVRQTGRLDLVVNNAGIGLIGGAEESSIAQAQRLFDVNVFGVARVANAVLPVMRKQKSGRIINMSSILGLIPAPYNAFYASTKHALEGYSESLDHEVRNFGIRVVLVQPGVTRTSFEENLTRADQPLPVYASERARSEALMRKWVETGDAPEVVADMVVKAATAKKPKLRYSAGKQSRQVRSLRRYLPERLVDSLLRKVNEFPASA
ncbi:MULTISPECIES: oxidoreductase [Rhizobium]|uniref:oxidoreductase n=1 Tax=Rhizobium TaxID=379 RepID=UPI0007E9B665|nr:MULTISPECIES: oxidoreductase [Rhizobium]ANK84586.1 short-chain dehydrogenase protein [Rhizobium sp. N731]ANK90443.1 short-chain dehydrogenase protein [Rhizobium sp. N6212]ANK96471.1 short-chain dehydrogenase protein [Rhizobium sp. N621]ANL02515.1 short-chain dehydrogenase protein [Rhizobium esperanzae]ANL08643.1 short-chain dehydrogenase protein [Rhizobium sp. N1341]